MEGVRIVAGGGRLVLSRPSRCVTFLRRGSARTGQRQPRGRGGSKAAAASVCLTARVHSAVHGIPAGRRPPPSPHRHLDSGATATKPTLPRPAILAAAFLTTVLSGAAQAVYLEDFNATTGNNGYVAGQVIAGSDFGVLNGVATSWYKTYGVDHYVALNISDGLGPTTITSTTRFNLDAGVRYKLSFDFSRYSHAPGIGPFNWNLTASIGDYTTTVDGFSQYGAPLEWHKVDLYFTPDAGQLMVPIIFAAVGLAGATYGEAPIDNVSFSTAPVPEPGSWAMLLAGLGLVGFVARRRQA